MKFGKKTKLIVSILLICVLVMGSAFSTTAAKKVKSKSVTMHVTKAKIGMGDVITLGATMKPANSTDSLKWSSSNKKVATVNKYGVVTAVSYGTATIKVKTSSNKTATCKLTVKRYLSKSEIDKLIEDKMLSEETVQEYVKKYSLTEENVLELIENNTLSEETVKQLIAESTLSEETVKQLIMENTLSEDNIVSLIKRNTLSEKYIVELIKNNNLTEEEVLKLISENTLSEETVIELIKNNIITLTEESIKQLIAENALTEETVLALIKDNTLSEEAVEALIKENTLSEEEIIALIKANCNSDSGTDNEWTGTKELKLYDQELPYSQGGVTVNSISIKKEHFDGTWQNELQKYKYTLVIKGNVIDNKYNEDEGCKAIKIRYFTDNDTYSEQRYYQLKECTDRNLEQKYTEQENGDFILEVTQYNVFINFNTFFIFYGGYLG